MDVPGLLSHPSILSWFFSFSIDQDYSVTSYIKISLIIFSCLLHKSCLVTFYQCHPLHSLCSAACQSLPICPLRTVLETIWSFTVHPSTINQFLRIRNSDIPCGAIGGCCWGAWSCPAGYRRDVSLPPVLSCWRCPYPGWDQ